MVDQNLIEQIDPLYFMDYAIFTGLIRDYSARTFEEVFKTDPNPIRRPLHFVNLVKEEYAAYEDVAAFLLAFISFKKGEVKTPIEILFAYRPGDAYLATIFEANNIISGNHLFDILKFDEWIPPTWMEWFPQFDLEKTLHLMCNFFVDDCLKNQKKYGIKAFNKIKHGLLLVPSGRRYLSKLPEGPASFILGDNKVPTLYGFNPTDTDIENRYRSIHFIQCNLRLLAALYVCWRYPNKFGDRGFKDAREFFESPSLSDVSHFLKEISVKK